MQKNYNSWLGKKIILLGTLENKTRVLRNFKKQKYRKIFFVLC